MSNELVNLHSFIVRHYDLGELGNLSFAMGIDFEELLGERKSDKARDLILVLRRQERLDDLMGELYRTRSQPFTDSGLDTNSAFLDKLYASSSLSVPFEVQNLLSEQQSRQILSRFLLWNLFVKRDVAHNLIEGNFQFKRWEIVIFTGTYVVHYSIRRHKNYGQLSPISKDLNKPEDWRRVNCTSKEIKVSWAEVSQPFSLNAKELELAKNVLLSVNGVSAKRQYNWWVFNIASKISFGMRRIFSGFGGGLYESAHPSWPNLSGAAKWLEIPQLQEHERGHVLMYEDSSIFDQIQNLIDHKFCDAVNRTNHAELMEVKPINKQIRLMSYPFWIMNVQVDDNIWTVVINGFNGRIVFAYLPISLWAKIITVAIPIAIIVSIIALLSNL